MLKRISTRLKRKGPRFPDHVHAVYVRQSKVLETNHRGWDGRRTICGLGDFVATIKIKTNYLSAIFKLFNEKDSRRRIDLQVVPFRKKIRFAILIVGPLIRLS